MRTLAHRCMYTKSSHREPQRARDPPEGGSGQTPRQSSVAGTAPTWPAGKETLSAWPKDGAGLGHVLTYCPSEDGTRLSSGDPTSAIYSAKSLRPCSFGVQKWRHQFFLPDLAAYLP